MYHRIADKPVDFWGLAVSPANFEEQLRVVRRDRYPIPLPEFVDNLIGGTLPANAIAVTFDDGYVDNLLAGKSLLVAADVPATVFLPTGFIDRFEPFWWDEVERLILLDNCPRNFELSACGETIPFQIDSEYSKRDNDITPSTLPESRRAVLRTVSETLRRLDDAERAVALEKLRSIFGLHEYRPTLGRAMSGKEVKMLVADGLVTIGAHTVTHPMLSGLEAEACRHEITESKLACEALLGAPVASFAYPYGDFNAEAREAVIKAGFTFACSMRPGPVVATSDVFALPRMHVPNLGGDAFERALGLASVAS